ncbi:hypothetical protein BCR39DRAFT_335255 [Naematelia encephala]|uniref:Uncharacterized protein n=1 Tax=Naematelia encephala TaxID=71784 RepID=A0A1Y2ANY8_9TREE|nr:hypothetical protein BCR39DRAFT_335255 [Naematelia encephala]
MKKLTTANPSLTFPERKEYFEQFVPAEARTDYDIALFIEGAQDAMDDFVQQARDAYCADSIVSWAASNQNGVYSGFKQVFDNLSADEKTALLSQLSGSQ